MRGRSLIELSASELGEILARLGARRYRAGQILDWVWRKGAAEYAQMTDLPIALRDGLSEAVPVLPVSRELARVSSDGTRKYLLKTLSGDMIEAVAIPSGERATVCLSTQVGCAMGCVFCASRAAAGSVRNLSAWEILGQVLAASLPGERATNVVFMGSGEPLLNYESVIEAARAINDPVRMNLAARHVAISTVGVVEGIRRLAGEGLQMKLAISLHAADPALRRRLVPAEGRWPLAEVLGAAREYSRRVRLPVTLEYALIDGVNDSPADARALARLAKGAGAKVNLIALNPVPGGRYGSPGREACLRFLGLVKGAGARATFRNPRGLDIEGACGQLRAKRKRRRA